MRSLLIASLTIAGILLLALDRVMNKEQVIKFDEVLKTFVQSFRPLHGSPYPMVFMLVMMVLFVKVGEPAIRAQALRDPEGAAQEHALFFFVDNWHWLIPLIVFIEGCVLGLRHNVIEKHSSILSWKALVYAVLFSLFMFIYFALQGIVGLVHLALWPMMYPLKGILVLNNRWFNSFSGVIGLIMALSGTVLQFVSF